jgi:hypothetical protein
MAAPKKPLVNWFSRTKSVDKKDTESSSSRTKKVTAPESKLSMGFTKEVTRKSESFSPNDSTRYSKSTSLNSKVKTPNAKGGGGSKIDYYSDFYRRGGSVGESSDTSYNEKSRKPSTSSSGMSKIKAYGSKDERKDYRDSTISSSNLDKKTKTPKLNPTNKVPLTNFANRTKEITKKDSTDAKGKTFTTTTRKVSTPASKTSSGFDKTKVKTTTDRKISPAAMGGSIAAAYQGLASMNPVLTAIGGASLARQVAKTAIPKTVAKNKTKTRKK